MTKLATPEHLIIALKKLTMPAAKRVELNKRLGNMARKYFRQQISNQRDVLTGKEYLPRSTRANKWARLKQANKQRARRMFTGISRDLRAYADADGFRVGLEGLMGKIGMAHQEGQAVEFSYRMHGFFNKSTKRWEGGRKQTGYYNMPERPFLGWSDELIHQLENEIVSQMRVTE